MLETVLTANTAIQVMDVTRCLPEEAINSLKEKHVSIVTKLSLKRKGTFVLIGKINIFSYAVHAGQVIPSMVIHT